jgi:hypothetical protein
LIKGLKELNCSYCPLLTNIPLIKGLGYYCEWLEYTTKNYTEALEILSEKGCPWLLPSKEKLNKVITLQKYFKKSLLLKRLDDISNDILNLYYQPDNKGFYLMNQKFNN